MPPQPPLDTKTSSSNFTILRHFPHTLNILIIIISRVKWVKHTADINHEPFATERHNKRTKQLSNCLTPFISISHKMSRYSICIFTFHCHCCSFFNEQTCNANISHGFTGIIHLKSNHIITGASTFNLSFMSCLYDK